MIQPPPEPPELRIKSCKGKPHYRVETAAHAIDEHGTVIVLNAVGARFVHRRSGANILGNLQVGQMPKPDSRTLYAGRMGTGRGIDDRKPGEDLMFRSAQHAQHPLRFRRCRGLSEDLSLQRDYRVRSDHNAAPHTAGNFGRFLQGDPPRVAPGCLRRTKPFVDPAGDDPERQPDLLKQNPPARRLRCQNQMCHTLRKQKKRYRRIALLNAPAPNHLSAEHRFDAPPGALRRRTQKRHCHNFCLQRGTL